MEKFVQTVNFSSISRLFRQSDQLYRNDRFKLILITQRKSSMPNNGLPLPLTHNVTSPNAFYLQVFRLL